MTKHLIVPDVEKVRRAEDRAERCKKCDVKPDLWQRQIGQWGFECPVCGLQGEASWHPGNAASAWNRIVQP